jgi:hypothetical protein
MFDSRTSHWVDLATWWESVHRTSYCRYRNLIATYGRDDIVQTYLEGLPLELRELLYKFWRTRGSFYHNMTVVNLQYHVFANVLGLRRRSLAHT